MAASFLAFGLGAGNPAEVKIIANSSIVPSEISRSDLNDIFLIVKTSLPGSDHVEPVLERKSIFHALFLKEYIGKTDSALMTYYRSLMFTGKASIPRSFDSDARLTDYVARTKGAIGYVAASSDTAGVKVLKVR